MPTDNEPKKDNLIDVVIERIEGDILCGDTEYLVELLKKIDRNLLLDYLPEDQWDEVNPEDDESDDVFL